MKGTIGDRLKKLRNQHNFTQEDIASFLNYDQSYITKLENNQRNLKVSALEKLCELYNCSEEYILNGTGEYSKPGYDYRSNIKNVDMASRYKMNKIIRNLEFLYEITK